MKTPFQKMLLSKIQEQSGMDILQQHLLDFPEPDDQRGGIDIEGPATANSEGDWQDDANFPFETPDGAVHQDLNGNGVWDEGEPFMLNGVLYYVQTFLVVNPSWPDCPGGGDCSQFLEQTALTYNYYDQLIGFVNGAWQCIMQDADGNNILMPNMWAAPGGWFITAVQVNGVWTYFMTTDDIMGEDVTWWNPTQGVVQGTYPSWAANFGWSYGDFGGNIPLMPLGDYQPIHFSTALQYHQDQDSEGQISIGFGRRFGAEDEHDAEFFQQEGAWTAFWNWYFSVHGEYPPQKYWPTSYPWWDDWWNGPGGPFEGHADEWEESQDDEDEDG